jgi:hypothetical protein
MMADGIIAGQYSNNSTEGMPFNVDLNEENHYKFFEGCKLPFEFFGNSILALCSIQPTRRIPQSLNTLP